MLVTVRLREHLPSLRRAAELALLQRAFLAASSGHGFRVVHASVQSNHLHLLVEARGRPELSLGVGGMLIRIARGLNRLWSRRGRVVADRYHARILRTPREVRNALVYVLHNARKHGACGRGIDPFTSGPWFDGWRDLEPWKRDALAGGRPSPFAEPSTWLLREGWTRHGRIGVDEAPAGPRRVRRSAASRGLTDSTGSPRTHDRDTGVTASLTPHERTS